MVLCRTVALSVALWAILFFFGSLGLGFVDGGSLGHLGFVDGGSLGHLGILLRCRFQQSDGSCGFLGLFYSGLANMSKYKGCLVSFENLKG